MPKLKNAELQKAKKKDLLEQLQSEKKELATVRGRGARLLCFPCACCRRPLTHPPPLPRNPPAFSPQLRVAKVGGGAPSKVAKIKQTRRNVARIMTALNLKSANAFKKEIAEKGARPNQIPKKMRLKKTRAIRRALPTKYTGEVRWGAQGGELHGPSLPPPPLMA